MNSALRTLALLSSLAVVVSAAGSDSPSRLTARQKALHAINRLAFGPRPGDVDRIVESGVETWIDQQLHPEQMPDRALEARLSDYPTLKMSGPAIWDRYYTPVLEARKEKQRQAAEQPQGSLMLKDGKAEADSQAAALREMRARIPAGQRPQRLIEELSAQRIIRAAESDRQLNEVMVDFWMNHFNVYAGKGLDRIYLTTYERDTIRPLIWGRFEDLLLATAKSPAMLFYLDNARSVAAPENRPQPGQRAMRAAGIGGPRLGGGRARFPGADEAMMLPRRPQAQQQKGGLNENYAREIMELHTLGVEGGYTQLDVTELARVLTGWSIARPEEGGGFIFRAQAHDIKPKTVLGVRFAAGGGMEEGERMIHFLAHRPATAHHIAWQLCQRLIADDPPKSAVDRVAKKFLDSDGDLRQTVKAVIDSPEFWSPQYYRAKVKSPFEYVISAVRATGATLDNPLPIARALNQIGEGLYLSQPPTGYSDAASVWINTGALLSRLNFALSLSAGKLPGTHVDLTKLISASDAADPKQSVDALAAALVGGELAPSTRRTIDVRIAERKAPVEDPWYNTQLPTVAGLILGSPEFQRQ
jgi:uncharacterized protein (DUF1800 family)